MTRELYIDNQRVDLPEDVRFQLTFQIADFGELKPRGSGSNTIKLPKTPRDIMKLDFKKPVYLRQYAQAYIVTKVNYQHTGSTVEMLLIR